jgi:hypothetical protein
MCGEIWSSRLTLDANWRRELPERELAAGIARARFVALEGKNHLPLPQHPATQRMLEEIRLFLK